MTISDVLEYVDDVKENEFTEAEKVQWINEIEGYVQIQIMLLAQPECKRYYASNTTEIAGIAFPTDSQMVLPKKIKAHKGGYISIEDLSDYSQNNKSDLEILGVSEDRRTLTFAEGTFVAGAEPESGTAKIIFDCADTELLVPAPYEKLYYEYLLSKISENLEESREQNNRLATFRDTWENYAAWYATVYRPADGKAVFRGYYIKGDPGEPGRGEDGKDAYQIAVEEGFEGTVQEWLESLKGSDGQNGTNCIHEFVTENDIADADEVGFYNLSAGNERKTTWANIKAKLKAYFDNLYIKATELQTAINTALAQAKESGEFDGEQGPEGPPGRDGQNGADGAPGADGYTPVKGVDYFDGAPGADGTDGRDGTDGQNGITPHIGSNGNWYIGDTDTGLPSRGVAGQNGSDGTPGPAGADGHTPVKGTDYWTAADKQGIVNDVLAALPDGDEVSY